ncbi:TY-Chap domain-containing protein [Aldersonia kunmingensis]|uniref:TY-Chap domain-containing protein n=1 Tax=Aldersonia kunmingensis TaxID=408066 RepID=UPI000830940A|nr:hypothetical protein [Aldersonia kunmingensis]
MDANAWRRFRDKLADHIADMADGDVLLLEYRRADDAADSACVQFFGWGSDLVRCEVPANQFLHPAFRLDDGNRDRLLELGWQPPTDQPNGSSSYHLDRDRTHCDELAALAVQVLREMWGVPHPTLLDSITGGRADAPAFVLREEPPVEDLDFGSAIQPSSRRHLQLLVERTMGQLLGHEPQKIDEDLIVLDAAFGSLWISVVGHEPVVEITTYIERKVRDEQLALTDVVGLGVRLPSEWFLDESGLVLTTRVDSSPFVPRHLINALRDFYDAMHELDAFLPETLGDPVPAGPGAPPRTAGTHQLGLFDNPAEPPTLFDEFDD